MMNFEVTSDSCGYYICTYTCVSDIGVSKAINIPLDEYRKKLEEFNGKLTEYNGDEEDMYFDKYEDCERAVDWAKSIIVANKLIAES